MPKCPHCDGTYSTRGLANHISACPVNENRSHKSSYTWLTASYYTPLGALSNLLWAVWNIFLSLLPSASIFSWLFFLSFTLPLGSTIAYFVVLPHVLSTYTTIASIVGAIFVAG